MEQCFRSDRSCKKWKAAQNTIHMPFCMKAFNYYYDIIIIVDIVGKLHVASHIPFEELEG